MEKFSLRTINKQAHRYVVCVYPEGGIEPELEKEYKSYRWASAFAVRQSKLYPSGRVELLDIGTDRDYYIEDLAASQEYYNGSLDRDGLPLTIRDRISNTEIKVN